jgi:DNA-binding response OmpR family regulator
MTGEATPHAPGPPHPAGRAVLVVDDEQQMRAMLQDNLAFDGYVVRSVNSGEEALDEVARHAYSLVILDVMLPGISGVEVCRRMRSHGVRVPVLMLTARSQETDRITGLDVGADDYVTKPFSILEVLARVRALVRRDDWHSGASDEVTLGDVQIRLRQRLVLRRGRRIPLSAREFELLRYLLAHRNEVVSREQLLRDVWGYHELSITRTVDNYIAKLRTQIEPRPRAPRYIVTVHGSGYQLLV